MNDIQKTSFESFLFFFALFSYFSYLCYAPKKQVMQYLIFNIDNFESYEAFEGHLNYLKAFDGTPDFWGGSSLAIDAIEDAIKFSNNQRNVVVTNEEYKVVFKVGPNFKLKVPYFGSFLYYNIIEYFSDCFGSYQKVKTIDYTTHCNVNDIVYKKHATTRNSNF